MTRLIALLALAGACGSAPQNPFLKESCVTSTCDAAVGTWDVALNTADGGAPCTNISAQQSITFYRKAGSLCALATSLSSNGGCGLSVKLEDGDCTQSLSVTTYQSWDLLVSGESLGGNNAMRTCGDVTCQKTLLISGAKR